MGKKAQMIPPDAYPQMLTKAQARLFSQHLRSPATEARAARIIENAAEPLRGALLTYVETLEAAGHDLTVMSDMAYEIRGFGDTAGVPATARIAEGLCRYMENSQTLGAAPDTAVLALHVSAIGRAARATDRESRMSDTVAKELAALATHKLAEITPRR